MGIISKWFRKKTQTVHILGYTCVIKRTSLGYLCGYVQIPRHHPWYCHKDLNVQNVHGGITARGIGYDLGLDDANYYIGFDCAHLPEDYIPSAPSVGKHYRDVYYVHQQLHNIVTQARKA